MRRSLLVWLLSARSFMYAVGHSGVARAAWCGGLLVLPPLLEVHIALLLSDRLRKLLQDRSRLALKKAGSSKDL